MATSARRPNRPAPLRRTAERRLGAARGRLARNKHEPPPHDLHAALQAVDTAVLMTDAERRITWCNPAFSRLSGYGLCEVRGRSPGELLQSGGGDAAATLAMRAALRAGRGFAGRLRNRAKDGRAYWVAVEMQPLFDRCGRLEGFVSLQTDVTDSVLAQERLGHVIDSAAAGIVVQDAHGTIVRCNPEAERLLEVDRALLLGRTPARSPLRLHGEDGVPRAWQDQHPALRRLLGGQEVSSAVCGVRRADGGMRWLQLSSRLLAGSSEAAPSIITSFVDVTAQKAALAELATERRRLDAALHGTQAGVWEWNLQTHEARVDRRWIEIAGYSASDLEPVTFQTWIDLVHRDDVPRLVENQRRHAGGELAFFHVDCRMRRKEGRWMWVSVRGRIASRSADGRPLWMVGTHLDIDDAKRSELELQRVNTKLQALFDLSPVGIALNDLADARFLEFNAALLKMTGYDAAEFGALRHVDICPREARAGVALHRERLDAHGRYGPFESVLVHKDGHHVPVQMTGMRVVLPDGAERIWSIIQDIEPRKRMEQQLRHEARTDRLTGLPNRALLMERLKLAVQRVQADPAHRFALLFIDFDRFKLVNDTLGHDSGDQLLCLIADRLREALHSGGVLGGGFGDDPGRAGANVVARFGGDEFVVLLHGASAEEETRQVAERLLALFAVPYVIGHKELHSSASLGIVFADTACESAESLLRNADMAMYEAKRAGRGGWAFFDPEMLTRVTRTVRIEEALRRAIQRGQLSVAYQPIVNLDTGEVSSAEALVRWFHPELGHVSPTEFIPIAEDSGLIVAIGEWVLGEACRQWRRWREESPGRAPATISVNLSRVQMSQGEQLLERVAAILAECGMKPHQLQLEVTEREVMRDPAGARLLMDRLRAMGVRLAMDDFGTGTSSLGCLRDYPFDVIKIDKSFIDDLSGSADMLAVIHATVSVVENLGMVSVAEGIEEEVQVGVLQSLGCRFGQGYFFSRPVPGDELLGAVRIGTALVAEPIF